MNAITVQPYVEQLTPSPAEQSRAEYQLSLLLDRLTPPFSLVDLGAGISPFPILCAEQGIDITAVDDYCDDYNAAFVEIGIRQLRAKGVKIVRQDLFSQPLPFSPNSLDAICSFHSMEHWHQSPKRLFRQCMTILKPGGIFLLSGPNCVNLRKRITVPLGHGKWTQMADWYEVDHFRSHVREPDVDDLRYIANDMGLVNVNIYGRNFLGMVGRNAVTRISARMIDPLLRLFPGLCSDIYMIGSKP